MNGDRRAAANLTFPDAVFLDEDETVIKDYVNIQTVLETNDYVPIGGGRYQDQIGNIGKFVCHRCLSQGCSIEVSMFRDIGMSNFFSHVQHHGCNCEEHGQRRQPNTNRRTLSWSYALFGGRGTATIVGCPDHRLVAYLPMPDYIPDDHKMAFRTTLLEALNSETGGPYLVPVTAGDEGILLPTHLAGFHEWMDGKSCPISILAYMCEPNLPRRIHFNFLEYEFQLMNSRRHPWDIEAMFFQKRQTNSSLNNSEYQYDYIQPERVQSGGRTLLKFKIGEGPIFSLNNHLLGRASQYQSNVMGPVRQFRDSGSFSSQISEWAASFDGIEGAVVVPLRTESPNVYAIPDGGDYTHVWLQPADNVPWEMTFKPHGGDPIDCTDDELEFQRDAQFAVSGLSLRLNFEGNNSGKTRVHYLRIRGFGTLNLRSSNRKQVMEDDFGGGTNELVYVRHQEIQTFEGLVKLLKRISAKNFDTYQIPQSLCDTAFGLRCQADLHRHIVWHQLNDPDVSCSTHRLSRIQNQIDMILQNDDLGGEREGAYILLESLGEIIFGNWAENNDFEEVMPAKNVMHGCQDSFFQPANSHLAFVYSLLPTELLSERLGCNVIVSEEVEGGQNESIILLASGHRLASRELLDSAGFMALEHFPGCEKFPSKPYDLVRSCFSEETRETEIRTYRGLSENFTQTYDTGATLHGFSPMRAEGYGRLRRATIIQFMNSHSWTDLMNELSGVAEIIDDGGNKFSIIAYRNPLPYPDPHTNLDATVALFAVMESQHGERRASKLFGSSDSTIVPTPWREFHAGLANGRSKKFLRYEALNLVLLAFSACISRNESLRVDAEFLLSLMPISLALMLDDELRDELRAVDPNMYDALRGDLLSSVWIGED